MFLSNVNVYGLEEEPSDHPSKVLPSSGYAVIVTLVPSTAVNINVAPGMLLNPLLKRLFQRV